MHVNVPALRGKMGSRTYYSCLIPIKAIPQFFRFVDWAGIEPEDREQRVLSKARVPEISRYIAENPEDFIFSSIVASYKTEPDFVEQESDADGASGILRLRLGDEFIINDGQHRCAGIAAALAKNPDAGGDTAITVVLLPYESKERVRQVFSDLNRFVAKTSKSLDILYDRRDEAAIATTKAIERVPIFRDLTDLEAMSLGRRSENLFTLAALYEANVDVLAGHEDDLKDPVDNLVAFWNEVASDMPDWEMVRNEEVKASDMRAQKICAHSTVLRALGAVGSEIVQRDDWKEVLLKLQDIDWSRDNPEFRGVCVMANGSVVSNNQARAAMREWLKRRLGLKAATVEPLAEPDQEPVQERIPTQQERAAATRVGRRGGRRMAA